LSASIDLRHEPAPSSSQQGNAGPPQVSLPPRGATAAAPTSGGAVDNAGPPQVSLSPTGGAARPWGRPNLSPEARRSLGFALLFIGAYAGLDWVTHVHAPHWFPATPWNPQPALAVALIALGGLRLAPIVAVAALAGDWLAHLSGPWPPGSPAAALASAAVYVATGELLRRWRVVPDDPFVMTKLSRLITAAVACAVAAAFVSRGLRWAVGDLPGGAVQPLVVRATIGDLLGLVVVAPLLFALAGHRWAAWSVRAHSAAVRWRDALFFVAAFALLLAVVFALKPFDQFRTSYLLFLPLVVISLRHGLAGAVLAVPAAQIGLMTALALFPVRSNTPFEYQLLMLTLAVTTLYLGALATERADAVRALARRDAEMRERQHAVGQTLRAAAASEVASSLAHELNQPLSAIGTYARACREMMGDLTHHRDSLASTLEKVTRESARAGEIVRRMREFFRAGSLRLESTPAAELLRRAVEHTADRCARHQIEVRLYADPALPAIEVDRLQMGATLINLLNNAVDVLCDIRAPRQITVWASVPEPGRVRIDIEDNGPGIAVEVRDRLFEPLVTSKPDGMGLGLAMSRSIVEGHGGSLWLDTQVPHTRFSIVLHS
jgi:two-component system sensor kinase FixL